MCLCLPAFNTSYTSGCGGFSGGTVVKNLPSRRHGFNLWVGQIPWRRKWQPSPVFLPRKSHGQRNLAGYSPWGRKRAGHDLATKQQQQIEDSSKGRKIFMGTENNTFRIEVTTWGWGGRKSRSLHLYFYFWCQVVATRYLPYFCLAFFICLEKFIIIKIWERGCYRLNAFVLPKFICWKPNAQWDGIRR